MSYAAKTRADTDKTKKMTQTNEMVVPRAITKNILKDKKKTVRYKRNVRLKMCSDKRVHKNVLKIIRCLE